MPTLTLSPEPIRIVMIDDDESIREGAKSLLESVGYEVRTLASAEELFSAGSLNETCLFFETQEGTL